MHWQSARRVEELLAARFPKPVCAIPIRRLPMQPRRRFTSDAGSNCDSAPILETRQRNIRQKLARRRSRFAFLFGQP